MATVTITHNTGTSGGEAVWVPTGTAADGDAVAVTGDGKYVSGDTGSIFDNTFTSYTGTVWVDPGTVAFPSNAVINSVQLSVVHSLNNTSTLCDVWTVLLDNTTGATSGGFAFDEKPIPGTSAGTSFSQLTNGSFTYTRTFATNPNTRLPWTRAEVLRTFMGISIASDASNPGGLAAPGDYHLDSMILTVTFNATTWQLDWSPYSGLAANPPFQLYQFGSLPAAFVTDFDFFYGGFYFPAGTSINWASFTGSPVDTGWFMSRNDKFAGAANIVENSIPKDVRTFHEIATFSAGTPLGGFPGCACIFQNELVYAAGGYTIGTTAPSIRIFNGSFDRLVGFVPNTSAGVVPQAVMSMIAANGTIYLSTFDTGTSSSTYVGRVFQLNIETNEFTPIGAAFTTGEIPYALCWYNGRLWCGTNKGDASGGKIYFFRPNIDTVWTSDHDTATNSMGGVASLATYNGLLYVGCMATSGTFAKVLVRNADTTYSTSDTGTGGTAKTNNGFIALATFGTNLYASYWNPDATVISKIRKFDGSSWSTAYTGASTTLVPYLGFPVDESTMLAIGGSPTYSPALLSTTDGTTWTDETAFLPSGIADTLVPAFGVVVK